MTKEQAGYIIGNLKDCEEYDPCEIQEAKAMAIDALWSDNWIPVSERLPNIGQRVLVTYNQEDKLKVDTTIFDKHGFLIGIVTAWMPLPTPYEPQESEDKEGEENRND